MSMSRKANLVGVEEIFRALADRTRLVMLRLLIDRRELCVCEVMDALNISQTRASRNLALLCNAGLLKGERRGKWMFYSVDRTPALASLLAFIRERLPPIAARAVTRKGKC
jgi:DNA-binding transcriptional ArsR family regulator